MTYNFDEVSHKPLTNCFGHPNVNRVDFPWLTYNPLPQSLFTDFKEETILAELIVIPFIDFEQGRADNEK